MKRVLVVGAGIAGAAAAWAARAEGASVQVISDRVGASGLSSGALDYQPWQEPGAADCALPEALLRFADSMGTWSLPDQGALVVSSNGVIRPTRGAERGLLDLRPLEGREIGVPDVQRADWDAVGLCKFLARDETVERLRLRFVPVRLPMLRASAEETCGSLDLAAAHDSDERVDWLAEKLSRHGLDAWLLGPWLGTVTPRSVGLSGALGVPIGETLSDVGEAAGLRTSAAIERLLAQIDVQPQRARLDRLNAPDAEHAGWRAAADSSQAEWRADAVVVACGGLASGGIALKRARRGDRGGAGLELNFSTDLLLEYNGRLVDQASSLHGVDFEHTGRALLEGLGVGVYATALAPEAPVAVTARRAGFSATAGATGAAGSVYVAGDVRAGGPRTVLYAAYSGLCAGAAAAQGFGGAA